MYERIIESDYDAVARLKEKLDQQPPRHLSNISMVNYTIRKEKHLAKKGINKVKRYDVRFSFFQEIHKIWTDYASKLRGNMNHRTFLPIVYKMELTGALISINQNSGYVVEERVNSIVVVHVNDLVRLYIKSNYTFTIEIDSVEYTFIGKNLKSNRFIKK